MVKVHIADPEKRQFLLQYPVLSARSPRRRDLCVDMTPYHAVAVNVRPHSNVLFPFPGDGDQLPDAGNFMPQ